MSTDKVAVDVIGDPGFFAAIAQEATRLDRSQSWIIQRCLRAAMLKLAALVPGPALESLKRSPLREPVRLQSLKLNLALADSQDPNIRDLATVPKGTEKRVFYMPRDLYDAFDREGDRLKLSADEILMFAWEQNLAEIQALPSVNE